MKESQIEKIGDPYEAEPPCSLCGSKKKQKIRYKGYQSTMCECGFIADTEDD